jgi:transcriptional regulator with XRE-family HTH domain
MNYDEKLRIFFKNKGLTQKKVSEEIGIAPAMISRYINGVSVFPADFLISLVKHYPDIDLQYIFTEEEQNTSVVNEQLEHYGFADFNVIEELQLIEDKIAKVRAVLSDTTK